MGNYVWARLVSRYLSDCASHGNPEIFLWTHFNRVRPARMAIPTLPPQYCQELAPTTAHGGTPGGGEMFEKMHDTSL